MSQPSLPGWLSIDTLERLLKTKSASFKQIVNIDYSQGSKKGDHHLSEIIRFKIVYRDGQGLQQLCVIHKDPSKGCTSFLEDVNGVEKEVGVYRDVVPYVNKVIDPVVPDCYLCSETGCLLLEDLVPDGYRGCEREKMLDFEHCRQALKSLGAFHAATARLIEISPSIFNVIGEETAYTQAKDTISYAYCQIANPAMIAVLSEDPEGKQFVDALKSFNETFWEKLLRAVNHRDSIQVLNQGDFWTSNIMFKYSKGVPIHAKLMDFQIVRTTSPAFDLNLFICTSMHPLIRESRLEELLDVYLHSLNSNLEKVGSKQTMTKEQLSKLMDETYIIALTYTLFLVPIVLCDPKDSIEISHTTKEDYFLGFPNGNPYEKAYRQKGPLNQVKSMLNYFRKKGYI